MTAVLHSVSFCAETRPEGVHEGPLFIYPHVGGWCRRAATAVFNAWSWPGKDPARDCQILRERCQGSPALTRGIRFLQKHFNELACDTKNKILWKLPIYIINIMFFSVLLLKVYPDFLCYLERLACAIHPLLDAPPVDIPGLTQRSLRKKISALRSLKPLVKSGNGYITHDKLDFPYLFYCC